MAAQLVFDTPRNREIFNRYRMALQGNPEWEPEGKMKYKRGGGIDTVNIDGVEYYKNTSYGNPGYLHLNEKKMPFKIAGKKSAAVSSFLDSAIPIATKYATAAAALGLPIAAGNPELVPASLLVQSDVHPILAKKLRKFVKEKTGYGVYNQMEGMGDSLALRRLKTEHKLANLKKDKNYKERRSKLKAKLKALEELENNKLTESMVKFNKNAIAREDAALAKAKLKLDKLLAEKQPRKKRVKKVIAENPVAVKPASKKTAVKKQNIIPSSITVQSQDNPVFAAKLQEMVNKGPIRKDAPILRKKPAAKKGGAMSQNPWLVEVRSYQHANPHLSWKEAMQELSAKRKGY